MFDHIHFRSYSGTITNEDLNHDAGYNELVEHNLITEMADEEWLIDGDRNYFLIPTPIPEDARNNLIYVQSFSLIESNSRYYTIRKNFHSYLLLFTYEGNGILEYEGNTYELGNNDIAIIDCCLSHTYKTRGNKWRHGDLHFFGGNSNYFFNSLFNNQRVVIHPANFEMIQSQLEKILRILEQNNPFSLSVEIQQLLLQLHTSQTANSIDSSTVPENLKYLRLYIEKHFMEDLSLETMASLAGITKYHLCREYKRHFGFSPKAYMLHLRMLNAEMLLQTTTIPAYRIAQISGFSNEANFINKFKKIHKVTPGEYRSSQR